MVQGTGFMTGAVPNRRRRAAWAGYAACAAALAYALPHLWWGLEIPLAFPGDFSEKPTQVCLGDEGVVAAVLDLAANSPAQPGQR
jgi:hypothetical protein